MKLANLPVPTAAHNFSSQRLLGNNFTQFQQLSAAPALATACFYTRMLACFQQQGKDAEMVLILVLGAKKRNREIGKIGKIGPI